MGIKGQLKIRILKSLTYQKWIFNHNFSLHCRLNNFPFFRVSSASYLFIGQEIGWIFFSYWTTDMFLLIPWFFPSAAGFVCQGF